jgi:ribonuclease HI
MMLHIFFDGACSGNPGPMAIGYVIFRDGNEIAAWHGPIGEKGTNNVAEYQALIKALSMLSSILNIETDFKEELLINGDSQLVINQVTGSWRCNDSRLQVLRNMVQQILGTVKATFECHVKLEWIPREKNIANCEGEGVLRTPELDKVKNIQEKSQAIGEFLEWMGCNGIHLAKYHENSDYLREHRVSKESLIAEFFHIDLKKVEEERQQLLESCREKRR